MASAYLDLVGKVADPSTQGLGRLVSQYVNSPKLVALLTGVYGIGQDLENLFQRIGHVLNPNTSIYATDISGNYVENSIHASHEQLRIIGQMVGVVPVLPNGDRLSDSEFFFLVMARIARNSCTGDVPNIREQLLRLFDPNGVGTRIIVDDLGGMAMHVQIMRRLTADERSILQITSGISQIPGGILPKPSGVSLTISESGATDVFNFSDANNLGTPIFPGDAGFIDAANYPTGSFAGVI
jgi:hypothetical protein